MATSQVFDSIIGTALAKTEGFSNINTSAPQKNVWSNPTSQLSTQELHLQLASTTLSPDPMPAVTNPGATPESHNTSQFYSPKVALSYSGEPILQSNTDLEQHRLGHGPAEGLTHDGTQVKFVGEQHVRALEPQLGSESQIADANGIEGPSSFEQMFPSAPKALPELQSVGAVGTTTALSSSNTLPNFPSVPNGQSGWMNQSGRLWESSGHERSGRQEEVAPLIEL
ncbi:hypothetical protein PPACK8108_LOCUS4496 [Phakopsora pachyrhizi]|uniref:Uncharacterized protein n=1 Tax=Phakopsora pachyrhizi TaxID=170000 RepID=A0AAV0AMC3_PHAPC|nr:hypothetical protein PPACK8108_LOCUS4496 [Phakopsora pachyrhizi]